MIFLLFSIFSNSFGADCDAINSFCYVLMPILSTMVLFEDDYIRSSLVNIYVKLAEFPLRSAALLFMLYRDLSELAVDRTIPTKIRLSIIFSLGNILNMLLEVNADRFVSTVSQSFSKQALDTSLSQETVLDDTLVFDDFLEPSEESFFEQKASSLSISASGSGRANHISPKKKNYSAGMTGIFLLLLEDQEVEVRKATLHVLFSLFGISTMESIDLMLLSTTSDLLCDESPLIVQLILDTLKEKRNVVPLPFQTIASVSILLHAIGLAPNARLICHDLLRRWRVQDTASLDSVVTNLLFCIEKKIDPMIFILETACHIGDLNFGIIKETPVWTRLLQVNPSYLAVEPSVLDPYCKK